MLSLVDRILEKIRANRISSTEIADCLGKTGALANVKPLNRGQHHVGPVFWAYAYNNSNWEVHEQLQNVPAGSVVVVETYNIEDRAVFGHLVSKYLLLYQGVRAIVINGLVRDAHLIIKDNFPVWCKGTTPIGCFNTPNELPIPEEVRDGFALRYDGSIAVCDDSGCVIVPGNDLNEELLQKLDFIELQEDMWYFCIDTRKWNTFQTVCLKEYLNDENLLPVEFLKRLQQVKSDKVKD
ncbi:MAG: RraA family protein [Syntrophomonas sp.]